MPIGKYMSVGITAGLVVAAVLLGLMGRSRLQRLPDDYADNWAFTIRSEFRPTPNAPWERFELSLKRSDQTLLSTSDYNVVQSDLSAVRSNGEPHFENTGLYAIDRESRVNLPGRGDVERDGQFLLPPETKPTDYLLWDSQYTGPRQLTYQGEYEIDGLRLLHFTFALRGLDESTGYAHLEDVPERYRALTDADGELWIEPDTGRLVDYREQGLSYFHNAERGAVADLHRWEARMDEPTRQRQRAEARAERNRYWLVSRVLPSGCLLLALAMMAPAWWSRRRGRP